MPLDPRERFTQTVEDYRKYRPTYPGALLDWLAETTGVAPPAPVCDLGCGTGIFSRLLAARGYAVVGIDPNPGMLEAAAAEGGDVHYVRGQADATGLADASVRLVTVAQAFHWFDFESAFREQRRIAGPAGWTMVVWNVRGDTPVLRAYDELLVAYSAEYRAIPKARPTIAALQARLGPAIRQETFGHQQVLDWAGFRGRLYSSSFVVHGIDDREGFDTGMREVFDRYQTEGTVTLDYGAHALAWPVTATSDGG